jgi:hypothetical protein
MFLTSSRLAQLVRGEEVYCTVSGRARPSPVTGPIGQLIMAEENRMLIYEYVKDGP